MSLYTTQSLITLRLRTAQDITQASTLRIQYKKPSGATGYWTATKDNDNQTLVYQVQVGDINESGMWEFQAFVIIGGREGLGKKAFQHFEQNT